MSIQFRVVRRILLPVFFLAVAVAAQANMASPYHNGTMSGTAFSSRSVDILSEHIRIRVTKRFDQARFDIVYTIHCDRSGMQIPLLFVAKDFRDSFSVRVDGLPVPATAGSGPVQGNPAFPFLQQGLPYKLDKWVDWNDHHGEVYRLMDLRYFEAALDSGRHEIRVSYNAKAWIDGSGWVNRSSLNYSLAPARYWKSFGQLEVRLELEGDPGGVTTNLGTPREGAIGAASTWAFDSIPADYIRIVNVPRLGAGAKLLLRITPDGIALGFGTIFALIHLRLTLRYRRRHPAKHWSAVAIIGSLIVPLLMYIVELFAYPFVDMMLEPAASGQHGGYYILVILLYPFVVVPYGIFVLIVDVLYRRYLRNQGP